MLVRFGFPFKGVIEFSGVFDPAGEAWPCCEQARGVWGRLPGRRQLVRGLMRRFIMSGNHNGPESGRGEPGRTRCVHYRRPVKVVQELKRQAAAVTAVSLCNICCQPAAVIVGSDLSAVTRCIRR